MANTIDLMLLDNKRAEALVNGYPYSLEGSYHIIAGEVNATEFVLSSVPSQYADCEFEIVGYNAAHEIAEDFTGKKYKVGDKFILPEGMAIAGYSQLNFSTITSDGENVKWLPIKLKVYNTMPNWAQGSIPQAEQLSDRIDALAATVGGHDGRIDNVESSVGTLQEAVEGLETAISNAKATTKALTNESLNYSESSSEGVSVVTVTDEDITENSHVELFPSDSVTETFLSEALVSNIIEVETGKFRITLNKTLPESWAMYYLIVETK